MQDTHIIVFIFGEDGKELLHKANKLSRHGVQLVEIVVGVDITVASANRVVDKEQIGEFVPSAIVEGQCLVTLDSVRTNLHQGAIFGAAARSTIQPYNGSLAVRNVVVLEVPEEQVAMNVWGDLDVTAGYNSC